MKYQEWGDVVDTLGYDAGRSLEYCLGDETKSVVFTPYEDYAATLGAGLNNDWNSNTASFCDSHDKINLARLDIGDGTVTFVIDGERRQVLNSRKESVCPYTLEEIEEAYENGDIDLDTYEYATEQYNNFSGFNANSIFFVDGALFLPLTPVDLSSFDSAADTISINIGWDIANAIHKANDVYFMDSRVNNTAFDFSVSISFE